MALQRQFLTSRVARRVFLLFVLSALIPLTAVSLLAYHQLGALLARQSTSALQAAAKSYGMDTFERLLLLDEHLRAPGADPGQARGSSSPLIAVHRTQLPDVVEPRLRAHLQRGRTALRIEQGEAGIARPSLLRLIDPAEPGAGLLIADVRPDYVWAPEALRQDLDYCVYAGRRMLFCSGTLAGAVPAGSAVGELFDAEQREEVITGSWDLFMEAQFATDSWTILARQPRPLAFEALNDFRTLFPIVLALTLAVVALLSVSQIRRLLVPLERLMGGTRRFAARDLAHRVSIDSNDEFTELASAMNTMADRLQHQFHTLDTLASIDRAILDATEVEALVEQVLRQIGVLLRPDHAHVLLVERDAPRCAHLYRLIDTTRVDVERVSLSDAEFERLGQPDELHADCRGCAHHVLLPVEVRKRAVGQLCVGWTGAGQARSEAADSLRGFADRLAVGIASAEREETLFRQAHYDNLTGLPNRQLLKDRLEQEIARGRREGTLTAVLLVDLDRFKNVNDSFGHTTGDQLLVSAAKRLACCIRETDTVARLGGDEFTLILSEVDSPEQASRIADGVVEGFSEPFLINGYEHYVGASVGITVAPTDGTTFETLLRNADTAMYRAKELGRGTAAFYEETMNARARQRIELESNLRQALARDELTIAYQPQIDVASRRIVAAEALLRWKHRGQVDVSPATFVPIAEETGLIVEIGAWVLESVIAQMAGWLRDGLPLQRVAINVSPRQLQQRGFAGMVRALLAKHRVAPQAIEVEITETLLIDNSAVVAANLEFLRANGIRLAMDDFGTGYSSMNYLTRVGIDTIKIDRSFIANLGRGTSNAQVVQAIIAMGHSLGHEIVAEGVETEQQYRFLRKAGCHLAQGYLFHAPSTAARLAELIGESSRAASRTA